VVRISGGVVLTCAVFGGLIVHSLGFWGGMLVIATGNLCLMLSAGSLNAVPSGFLATIVIGWFAFQSDRHGRVHPARQHRLERAVDDVGGRDRLRLLPWLSDAVVGLLAAAIMFTAAPAMTRTPHRDKEIAA
jgi:cytosine permease